MPYAKCLICNQEFNSLDEIRAHQDKDHPGQAQARCRLCGHESNYHSEARKHMDAVHPGWEEGTAPVTKEFISRQRSRVNTQRGNPSTPEIPITFDVVITPNLPVGIKGYGYFKGKWYNARQTGSQFCNLCGLPLVKFPSETDDPEMAEVYVPWRNFKLNEIHYKDVEPGKKFAHTFNDALDKKWEIKYG